MYIVITGSMSVEKWRGSDNKRSAAARRGEIERCQIGTTFGESCLVAATEFSRRRDASVRAYEASILAVLSRDIYLRIKRTSELQGYINKYWDMLMNDAFGADQDPSTDLCEEVRKRSFLAIYIYKCSFHQDRLGTNIRKAQKRDRFPAGHLQEAPSGNWQKHPLRLDDNRSFGGGGARLVKRHRSTQQRQ